LVAHDAGFMTTDDHAKLARELDEVCRMLYVLIRRIKSDPRASRR
jgi:hypothetical protein